MRLGRNRFSRSVNQASAHRPCRVVQSALAVRDAVLVHLTADTWAVVASTMAAAFLGAIVAYIGLVRLQRKQAERDDQARREQAAHSARIRLEAALAELLAAAQDVLIGIRAIREAHARRTKVRYYVRVLAVMWHAIPRPATWRDLIEYPALRSVLGAALELDRENTESQRIVAIDMANVLTPKLNRYFAVVALLTLGEDKQLVDAVRQLTPKVTDLAERAGTKKRDFERLSMEMQKALEHFREVADKRLGNVKE
jgi:membrane protein YqaA with SNARE-associated domain